MAIERIPQSFKYICDVCGGIHVQENASGHYSHSRPPHWAALTLERDAYDDTDGTVKLLLCGDCHQRAADLLNTLRSNASG